MVAPDQKQTTSNEKPSSSMCNRNEEDAVTSSKVKTSTNSSRVEDESTKIAKERFSSPHPADQQLPPSRRSAPACPRPQHPQPRSAPATPSSAAAARPPGHAQQHPPPAAAQRPPPQHPNPSSAAAASRSAATVSPPTHSQQHPPPAAGQHPPPQHPNPSSAAATPRSAATVRPPTHPQQHPPPAAAQHPPPQHPNPSSAAAAPRSAATVRPPTRAQQHPPPAAAQHPNPSSAAAARSTHRNKNRYVGIEAKPEHGPITRHEDGSVKLTDKASLLRAQQHPAEHRQLLQELKLEQAIHIASGPQDNSVGKHVDTIYKEEAVCKKCCKYMFDENIVLWAKCECKLALIHQKCATEWIDEKGSTCGVCGKEIENVSVTLTMDASTSSPQQSTADQHEKPASVSKKWYRRLF